jgi:hypothetical protein
VKDFLEMEKQISRYLKRVLGAGKQNVCKLTGENLFVSGLKEQ